MEKSKFVLLGQSAVFFKDAPTVPKFKTLFMDEKLNTFSSYSLPKIDEKNLPKFALHEVTEEIKTFDGKRTVQITGIIFKDK